MNPFLQLSVSSTRQRLVTNYAVCVYVKTFCGKTNGMSDCNVYISNIVLEVTNMCYARLNVTKRTESMDDGICHKYIPSGIWYDGICHTVVYLCVII